MTGQESKILTVTKLNELVKMLLDGSPLLSNVWVRGEISNFTSHSSGHLYFSLKDQTGRIMAVMFKREASKLFFKPENGMRVCIHGRVSVFPRDGTYQIYVSLMEPDGVGALYIAYEQLKRRLEAEGVFDSSVKKPLPKIPRRVGVITSPSGAAVRDIVNVMGRRFPYAEIVLYPSLVQGEGAEQNLIDGIRCLGSCPDIDVIIIGRGGGSLEDLWAFNSETLAREIRLSSVPVISAVGHETDFTICDFASDKRAPTPSAAAELAVPDSIELKRKLSNVTVRLQSILSARVKHLRAELKASSSSRVLTNPLAYIDDRRLKQMALLKDLERAMTANVDSSKNKYLRLTSVLEAVNPLKVLSKGYSAVFTESGEIVRSVKDAQKGDIIAVRTSDGSINAEVLSVKKEKISINKTAGRSRAKNGKKEDNL